jgi:predicted membrane-bound mannosyltransferase
VTAAQAIQRARAGIAADAMPRWSTAVGLGLLCALSLWLRTRVLGAGFWIDEGISVGIAHHPLTAIPHLLRQDGSPPLYYLLLHVWIGWFGDSERATHVLSLLPALACIPLAFWLARSLFGRSAGWICAALATVDPYLTYYGQETRMYTFAAFFSLVATAAFVRGVIEGRRRWLAVLVVSLDLLLYTHNWGLFFCIGLAAATVVFARERWREAVVAGAAVALLYAPWVPTLLYQARHTGAPWAMRPGVHALLLAPGSVFATDVAFGVLALAVAAGLVQRRREVVPMALLVIAAATILAAWIESQVSSTWTSRYFAVLLGPLLLAAGAGLARAGRLGIAALALALFLWTGYTLHDDKSNVRAIAAGVTSYVQPGDLVLSTHPEQVPALRYYLGPRVRYATQLGFVADPRVMDWRDALHRIENVTVQRNLEPVLASVKAGQHLVVVSPVFRDYHAWEAPWTSEVYDTSQLWTRAIAVDPRFREVTRVTSDEILLRRNYWKPLQAVVYVRRG